MKELDEPLHAVELLIDAGFDEELVIEGDTGGKDLVQEDCPILEYFVVAQTFHKDLTTIHHKEN